MSIFQFDQFNQRQSKVPQCIDEKHKQSQYPPQHRIVQNQYIVAQSNQEDHAYNNQIINRQMVQPQVEQNSFQQNLSPDDQRSVMTNYPSPITKEYQLSQLQISTPVQSNTIGQNQIQQQQIYGGNSQINQKAVHQNQQQINTAMINSQHTLNPTINIHTERDQNLIQDEGGVSATNYCTESNGARISQWSSYSNKCHPQNLLNSIRSNIWMSEEGLPQSVVVDLTNLQEKPRYFKCVGFDCWHDYSTNPAVIEISVSTDGSNFVTWATLRAELKAGVQLFSIDNLGKRYNFIKYNVKETHGASKVYMNRLYILEDNPLVKLNKLSNLTQQSLVHQTEVISPTNKNMSISQNTISKDLLQIRTSPIQYLDIQTQSSPQNMTLLNFSNQQTKQTAYRRSPSNNQFSGYNPQQYIQYQNNIVPMENQNFSYQDDQAQHYQQSIQNKGPQQDALISQQHMANTFQVNNNNQSKLQFNHSGVDEDCRVMSGSMINNNQVSYQNNQIVPQDYQRQNIIEDTRSIFVDPNNNSLNQMYQPHQIVDNIMSFSAQKNNQSNLSNNVTSHQKDFDKYVNPNEFQSVQNQHLKNSQTQAAQIKSQEGKRIINNSNQYQNTADFNVDNKSLQDGYEQNYRIQSNPKSLKSSGQVSVQPVNQNERMAWANMEQKYKDEVNKLQTELFTAKQQIVNLGMIVEKMQDTKNALIEKVALIAESLSLFKEEVHERLHNVEKDVAYANNNQITQGEKLLKEDLLFSNNKNGNATASQKQEPQKNSTAATLNTKQDILEKYLPRKNSSYHQSSVSPLQELANDQEKSISNIVNNVLDKKLQELEQSLSKTLLKSLNQIQQVQIEVGEKLQQAASPKDPQRDTNHQNYQSGKSSFNYQKYNSPSSSNKQYQSVRDSQMNTFLPNQIILNDPQFNSNGFSQMKSKREGDQVYNNCNNQDNITPHQFNRSALSGIQVQDQKNTRVIQLLDKLQAKLSQRQSKVEELNKKEKILKKKYKDQQNDVIQDKENRTRVKKDRKEKAVKQLFSDTSDILDY